MQHLLLLHGALGAKDQFNPLVEVLKADYVIHAINLSGHGDEPISPEGFTIPSFSQDVLRYLDGHDIEQANIFGYSMGGYVALYFAKQYPSRVKKVITLATKFHWDEEIAAREVRLLDADVMIEKIPAFADQLMQRHVANDWKLVLQKTASLMMGLGRRNELGPGDFNLISTPTLLLLGDNDKMITREETAGVKGSLRHADFTLLEQTSHPLEKTNLNMLASAIKNYIG